MAITSYANKPADSFPGMLHGLQPRNIVTGLNKVTAIPFGTGAVQAGTGDRDIVVPSASTDVFVGVSLHQHVEQGYGSVNATHAVNSAVPLLRRGQVWVMAEQAVTPSDPVFVRYTANGTINGVVTAAGQFRKDADTSRALQIPNARWVTSAAAGGLAVLEVNLP
jgi:hypothetical protein